MLARIAAARAELRVQAEALVALAAARFLEAAGFGGFQAMAGGEA